MIRSKALAMVDRGEDCGLPPLRDQQQEERQIQTWEQWQNGPDSCLVWHAISEKRQCTRRKNPIHHYNWPQEVPLHSHPFLPSLWHKVKAGDHFQAKEPAKVSTRRSCTSSPNDWKDEDGIKLWIEKVWKLQPGSLLRKRSLHVWDSFQAHLVDPAKDALCQTNTEDRLRERWTNWTVERQKSLTPAGNVKVASLETVSSWV